MKPVKILRAVLLSALALTMIFSLTSCNLSDIFGLAGITSPQTDAGTDAATTPDTSVTYSEMDLSTVDISQYLTLDYKGLSLEVAEIPGDITDAQVESELNEIMLYYEKYTLLTNRTTAAGDYIEMSYTGTMEGETFDGGSSDKSTILLDVDNSGYIDGFADGLIGITPGETVTLNLTFPEDYYEDVAGKAVTFTVTVTGICVLQFTDAIANELSEGEFTTMDGYREHLRAYLKQLQDYDLLNEVYSQIWEILDAQAVMNSYPDQQYQYYYQYYVNYCLSAASSYGLSYDDFMATYGYTDETLRQMAEDSVKSDLVVYYIANAENITMTDEEYTEYLESLVNSYNSQGYSYTADYIESYFDYYYGEGYLRRQAFEEAVCLVVYGHATLVEAPETTAAEETTVSPETTVAP